MLILFLYIFLDDFFFLFGCQAVAAVYIHRQPHTHLLYLDRFLIRKKLFLASSDTKICLTSFHTGLIHFWICVACYCCWPLGDCILHIMLSCVLLHSLCFKELPLRKTPNLFSPFQRTRIGIAEVYDLPPVLICLLMSGRFFLHTY